MQKYVMRWVHVGWHKETKSKIIGEGQKTVSENPHFVNRGELTALIQQVCNDFYEDGYEVISIMPTIRGYSNSDYKTGYKENSTYGGGYGWGYGWGYGFSVTDGAIITAMRRT